jgi:hypothetical protein
MVCAVVGVQARWRTLGANEFDANDAGLSVEQLRPPDAELDAMDKGLLRGHHTGWHALKTAEYANLESREPRVVLLHHKSSPTR